MTRISGVAKMVSKGEISLSPDLITAKRYFVAIRKGKKAITLIPVGNGHVKSRSVGALRVYYSNRRAKAGRISLGPFIRAIGLDPDVISEQEFPASMQGGEVTISFQ